MTPRPFSPYGTTKLAAEHLCQLYHGNHGVATVCLRYFSVYGPRQRPDMAFAIFCRAALRGEPLRVFGDGSQSRDFTYVGDVVRATRSAATAAPAVGGVYNLGGGSQISLAQAIELLLGFVGQRLELHRSDAQHGDVRHTGADTTRAAADLGVQRIDAVFGRPERTVRLGAGRRDRARPSTRGGPVATTRPIELLRVPRSKRGFA